MGGKGVENDEGNLEGSISLAFSRTGENIQSENGPLSISGRRHKVDR